jgi:hypothetical protein
MTREELIAKLEKAKKDDYADLKEFSRGTLDMVLYFVRDEDTYQEKHYLKSIIKEVGCNLEIMRTDIIDYDTLSIVKYLLEKRIKTIENEK